jgi:hypothetical protein
MYEPITVSPEVSFINSQPCLAALRNTKDICGGQANTWCVPRRTLDGRTCFAPIFIGQLVVRTMLLENVVRQLLHFKSVDLVPRLKAGQWRGELNNNKKDGERMHWGKKKCSPSDFYKARNGDHFIVPFECDLVCILKAKADVP